MLCRRFAASLVVSFIYCFSLVTHAQNPCGVKAIISPGNDSIINIYTAVNFQSASLNATSYKFIIGYSTYTDMPAFGGFSQGLSEVKLIAYNGNCSDTAVCYYFYPGTPPSDTANFQRLYGFPARKQEPTDLIRSTMGGYLVSGHTMTSPWDVQPKQGILMRLKEGGCIEWSRQLASTTESDIIDVDEAPTGGFFILGKAGAAKSFVAKIDVLGNVQWSKRVNAGGNFEMLGFGIKAMPDGGVVVAGTVANASANVIRFSPGGNIVWQKELDFANRAHSLRNILFKDNYIYVGGNIDNPLASATSSNEGFITKLDYVTGQTAWLKLYPFAGDVIYIRDMHDDGTGILVNVGMKTGQTDKTSIAAFMRIDTDGDVIKAGSIAEPHTPYDPSGTYTINSSRLIASGKSYYFVSEGMHDLSQQRKGKVARLDSSFNIKWVRANDATGDGHYYYPAAAERDAVVIAGVENGRGFTPSSYSTKISVRPIDSAGGYANSDCWFYDQPAVFVPQTITPQTRQWVSEENTSYSATDFILPWLEFYPQMRVTCPDYVDSCSLFKLTGPAAVCNRNNTYTYFIHKNKNCSQPVQWNCSAGVTIIAQNETTITVKFPEAGRYSISAFSPYSCTPIKDSIVVIASSRAPVLTLGADKEICPGDTITLRASKGFTSYEWPDGSRDSLLTVNTAGTYWVRVKDSCDNMLTDTIVITYKEIPAGFLPADTAICSYGEVLVQPVKSYTNYAWSNGSTSSSILVTQPGIYWLQAKAGSGCEGRDSIVVELKKCNQGLYAPNAFSPNNDGKNDVFRPMLFGKIRKFKFMVYNRWGQLLYATTDPTQGWDGKYMNRSQPNEVYVWVCEYQLEGEAVKVERGTVAVVR
jgi:gliding motility-associated-like protein